MTKRDSALLFDITTRLALFVEALKLGQMQEFTAVLAAVDEELRKLFSKIEYKTLDGLTKAELNHLLLALRKAQTRIYTVYTDRLIRALQDFMQQRLEVSAIAYASAKHNFDSKDEPLTFDTEGAFDYIKNESEALPFAPLFGLAVILPSGKPSLWSTIKNAPIPANGLNLLPFIQSFSRAAQASVENTIRKAYANKATVAETLAELNGKRTAQGNSTQFAKLQLQASAIIETSFSHVDQIVAQALLSALFSHYKWVSIMDGHTTTVCRERDNKVFRYGEGPVPPAHYRCRSVTVPLASILDDFDPPTLYAWLKAQPDAVQVEFLGDEAAALLNAGKLSAKDFANVFVVKPLKLNQFKSKLGLILKT